MIAGRNKRAVGVFSNYRDAEAAIDELRQSGFPMHRLSVVAQDGAMQGHRDGVSDRHHNEAGEGAATGAVAGAATGGLIGLIGSLSALTIPGVGPILAGGALATVLADTVVGGAIGAAAGGLVGALVGLGIPEADAALYNERVSRGDYLVMVEGTEAEVRSAEAILSRRGIQQWGVYDAPEERGLGRQRRAVGVFPSRAQTEEALRELKAAGFPMEKVSVIARDADREGDIAGVDVKDRIGNKADEGAATGAVTGGALGGITGLLIGLGALAIPGIGPIMLAGAEATAIATALAGGAIGAATGGLVGALLGLGIPEERARFYSDRVARGDYLVMVNGNETDIDRAEQILNARGIHEWGVYDVTDARRAELADYTATGSTRGAGSPPIR